MPLDHDSNVIAETSLYLELALDHDTVVIPCAWHGTCYMRTQSTNPRISLLGTAHALRTNMNSSRAEFLRNLINSLARELDNETNKAKIRCIKQSIRSAEFELTDG